MPEEEDKSFDNMSSQDAIWGLLVHLRSEYYQLKQADALLQHHRVQWMEYIEQWMSHQEAVVRHAETMRYTPQTTHGVVSKVYPPSSGVLSKVYDATLPRLPRAVSSRSTPDSMLLADKEELFSSLETACHTPPECLEEESTRECTNTSSNDFGGVPAPIPRRNVSFSDTAFTRPPGFRASTASSASEGVQPGCEDEGRMSSPLMTPTREGHNLVSTRPSHSPVKPVALAPDPFLEPNWDSMRGSSYGSKHELPTTSSRLESNGTSEVLDARIIKDIAIEGMEYRIIGSTSLTGAGLESSACELYESAFRPSSPEVGGVASHSSTSSDSKSVKEQSLTKSKSWRKPFGSSLVSNQSKNERFTQATPSAERAVLNWQEMVLASLSCAKKDLRQLRSVWVQSETFLQKAAKSGHPSIDIFGGGPTDDDLRNRSSSMPVQRAFTIFSSPQSSFRRQWTRNSGALLKHSYISNSLPFGPSAQTTDFTAFRSSVVANDQRKFTIIMNPTSSKRLGWVFIGMALMLYDLIVFPLSVFDPEDNDFFFTMKWFSQIYWTLDILVSFITGVTMNGELIVDPITIARVYIKTWFFFDCLVTMPLWVIIAFNLESTKNSSSIRSVRYFRMLRFLRLMRIAKFEHLLGEALEFVNSSTVILTFGIVKLMVYVMLLNHFNACLWFAIGNRDHGWADDDVGHTAGRPLMYQYFCAMHWALTQFQGTSDILPGTTLGERMYAAGFLLFALMIMASFVGSLTNMILQLQNLKEERNRKQRQIRSFLVSNKISMALSMRVKKYVEWKLQLVSGKDNSEVLQQLLPLALVVELLREVRGPSLAGYRFFELLDHCHPRVFRRICHEAVLPMWQAPNEQIFSPSDHAENMYFITSGYLRYVATGQKRQKDSRLGRDSRDAWRKTGGRMPEIRMNSATGPQRATQSSLIERQESEVSKGCWLCEAVLWVDWEHCGELVAVSDASILALSNTSFEKVAQSNLPVHAALVLYARRFLAALNIFGKIYTDYIPEGGIVELKHSDRHLHGQAQAPWLRERHH